jgi:hypothetical protein
MAPYILNAASCPFQLRDCHIKNHSLPKVKKAPNHISIPTVSPAIARRVAV